MTNICILTTKRRIPNSFAGTLFNRHRLLFETGQSQIDFSNLYYFLSSITDRSESINQDMNSVNFMPTEIPEKTFQVKYNIALDPSKLNLNCGKKS